MEPHGLYCITSPYVYYYWRLLSVRSAYLSPQMIVSAGIITILYINVALVLFGILTIDGGTWRLHAPTRQRNIREFFGQFSWGRLQRPTGVTSEQSIDVSTAVSDNSLDRGRKTKPKSVGKKSTPGMSVFDNGAASRSAKLKKLAIKMLWYPSGM
jgi:hypothetical protein